MNREVTVVTGGGQGIGRAVVERLLADAHAVVVVELRDEGLGWLDGPIRDGLAWVIVGDAADDAVAAQAAATAGTLGTLTGWVNNAAVFEDAWLHERGGAAVAELVRRNLQPCLAGAGAAVAAFRVAGTAGAIVNVSSHQAQRAVRGALPYATAKAAVEGLTRALAVDYGPWGIRVNAVAPGSIATERLRMLTEAGEEEYSRVAGAMADLHPIGRAGDVAEVAEAVAYLLSARASFISGAVVPVDGARSAQGADPEVRAPA
ncbi:SDR family NAD(P)-dependent oxidoreductase [Glycomyces harbinensis]|uniref:NAD(P)-dependent dehydrogenase, short-chain alcohol dehydrogenase family n=1 Tax=Glycomyces harbinensis TaxID=58114 RepID=A0A1G7C9L2_9ACTN|nr:SDR family oxidoreductase [Glycomyces harbinensis]SDE36064.1 NAD(P)-dependent dehydrogenase, short-chain alcohol dehydrogenase family [Glycomyces harbinensis]